MRLWITVVLALTLAGCAAVRPHRITNFTLDTHALDALEIGNVAVLPFKNVTYNFDAPSVATGLFDDQLRDIRRFTVLRRENIIELYKDRDLDPDRIERPEAIEIGRVLGVDGVVMGMVTDFRPGKVGVSARLLDVATGELVWEAGDTFVGKEKGVQLLVDPEDRDRLTRNPSYLCKILCRELVNTMR
jgi:TolB-like protein